MNSPDTSSVTTEVSRVLKMQGKPFGGRGCAPDPARGVYSAAHAPSWWGCSRPFWSRNLAPPRLWCNHSFAVYKRRNRECNI